LNLAYRYLKSAYTQAKLTSIQLNTIAHRHCERSEAISQLNRLLSRSTSGRAVPSNDDEKADIICEQLVPMEIGNQRECGNPIFEQIATASYLSLAMTESVKFVKIRVIGVYE
jgi:hypothetical protein